MVTKIGLFLVMLMMLFLSACGDISTQLPVSDVQDKMINSILINSEDQVIGEVNLSEGTKGVTIEIKAEGLSPGQHGIHIHEKGECTAPSFESAGGHFNPTNKAHGFNNLQGFHAGDLPNVDVGKDGKLYVVIKTEELTLAPGKENSILDEDGSALVIHEKEDDYKTDPSGNSGSRIACAIIK